MIEPRGHKSVSKLAYSYLAACRAGFLQLDGKTKKAIIDRIANGAWGPRAQRSPPGVTAFDMVRLAGRWRSPGKITATEVLNLSPSQFKRMKLVEVKATRGPRKRTLRELFFSFQYAEQLAAQVLGDRYTLVFAVINAPLAKSFYRTMTWPQMWAKSRSIHIQFSVRF